MMLGSMSTTLARCPLCGTPDARFYPGEPCQFDCRTCGQFGVTFQLQVDRDLQEPHLHPFLSAATRRAFEAGQPIVLSMENYRALADAQRAMRVSEKVTILLGLIAKHTETPGHGWPISTDVDYPLIAARDPKELQAYLDHLVRSKLLHVEPISGDPDGDHAYELTIPGWQQLEPMPPLGGVPGRCFVAMWFHDDMDAVYTNGIEPAVRDAGFTAYRVKEDPTNKGITDLVLSEIRRAQFVVADFTGHRNSVYFEAGFAHGIGREVIWCCKEDEISNLTFDTRHLGHIAWKDHDDLRLKLERSIRANILPKA